MYCLFQDYEPCGYGSSRNQDGVDTSRNTSDMGIEGVFSTTILHLLKMIIIRVVSVYHFVLFIFSLLCLSSKCINYSCRHNVGA